MNWKRFLHRDQADAEQRGELELHIDLATADNIARGMQPGDARRAAQRKLGNATQIREEVYRMNGISLVDAFVSALRYWVRTLRREPLFATVAVATLALGIGATTAIFSVVDGVLIKPLPYPHPEQLVGVWHTSPGLNFGGDLNIAPSSLLTYREHNRVFQSVGIWASGGASVTGLGEPEQVRSLNVTYGFLDTLEIPPLLGRWISREDDSPGTPETVVLGYGYWQRRFGGDRNILGRGITVQGRPRQIVGVMPQSFSFMNRDPEVILPLRFERARLFLGNFAYQGIARMKPGVTLAQANADLARMLPIWMESWPEGMAGAKTLWQNAHLGPALHPLANDILGNVADVLWVVMGTVGLVLLIACANVANLLLVRAESRLREWGVRIALGASRARVLVDSLAETLLLGLLGGAAGTGIAYGAVALLHYIEPANLPRLREIFVDGTALSFAAAVSILAGALFGAIPALKYAGSRLAATIRDGGRAASVSRERQAFRNGLVVIQVALSLVLLIISGLMVRTFQEQRRVRPGFSGMREVQTFRITIPPAQADQPGRVALMQNQIADKLAAIPGVVSVGISNSIPLDFNFNNDAIDAEGKPLPPGQNPVPRRFRYIAPGFLRTTGTRLIAGREFRWQEIHDLRYVAMISEKLAKELWGSPRAALGKHIRDSAVNPWREVVGVVEDVRDNGVEQEPPAMVYWPVAMAKFFNLPVMEQRNVVISVRSPGAGTEGLMNQIRQAVWSVNPNLPLARVMTFQQIYEQSMAQTSFALVILSIAAAMALLLGMVGIYGVLAYTVAQRRREVGIRLALGAQTAAVKRMFLRHGLVLSGIGIAGGLAAAAALSQLMASLLFGVKPLDPATFAATPVVLILAAAAACYIPARRAASVDPAETLRSE